MNVGRYHFVSYHFKLSVLLCDICGDFINFLLRVKILRTFLVTFFFHGFCRLSGDQYDYRG